MSKLGFVDEQIQESRKGLAYNFRKLHISQGVCADMPPRHFWHFCARGQILVQSDVKNCSAAVALYRKLYWGLKLAVQGLIQGDGLGV